MNYPVWGLPAPGLLIAAVAILHVFISHFAVGGGLFLVLAETKARREGDAALLGFVRALSRGFVLLTLVLGALTGVGIWFTIALVQPQATSALVTTFVWAWAIEWVFFATEIAAAMVYYYGWDRLDAKTHLRVGWVYFVSAWASLAVIAGILAFMLTSGDWVRTRGFADGFFNPTYLPMVALRTAVAVGLAGLYVLFAASFLKDADLKARIARWSATRWIAPAAVLIPLTLLWYLSVAAGAGVAVAETLGAKSASPAALLVAVFGAVSTGQPIVRGAARVAVAGAVLLVVGLARPRGAAGPPLRPARGRRAHGPRHRVDGRQRVGARGPAQALGDRPLHVRERRARGRARPCRRGGPVRPRRPRPARGPRDLALGGGARRLPARAIRPSRASPPRSGPRSRPRPAARSSSSSARPATPSGPTSGSSGWSGARASPRSRPSSTRRPRR